MSVQPAYRVHASRSSCTGAARAQSFGMDLILLDTAAAANSIVVSSIFGELYSDDGGQQCVN